MGHCTKVLLFRLNRLLNLRQNGNNDRNFDLWSFQNGLNESFPVFTDIFPLVLCCGHEYFSTTIRNKKLQI